MDNEPITKKDLKEILETELHEVLEVVNQGFNEQTKMIASIDQKFEGKFEDIEARFKDMGEANERNKKEILASNDKIANSNDKIAKEISDMRQEQTAHQGSHIRVNNTLLEHGDTLKNHEKRISNLGPSLARS
ncbi:hypothetical protein COU01_03145 [Candidatus Falkowbacteria bacterium CG10_big_fil_rev_8_21_14_0_10_44_15]|uniref:Uncharacterized protein n=1 Tax=Candidatus Falkowbacteria bacterium CG10_big_fil_rev_8_21_14_0_10_44_15 TaxID=1974569 RepID=A0A2H0UZF7_9BACT|nr:MAG: hypothetical protein COU01_03145 [Candidatus Falkowbacteria bacterium CG10_big_fil_rev_8_21_14_0_10_44_15]